MITREQAVTYAYTPFFLDTAGDTPPGRIVDAVFLHDTEGHQKVAPYAEGSWHYEIDRLINPATGFAFIYQFIDEEDIAFCVRACDRYWPPWLRDWGSYDVSRANEWGIHIELVSDAAYRAAGEAYTEGQYAALRWLLADLCARRGQLHVETHGRVQRDRSDPVALDLARVGLVPSGGSFVFLAPDALQEDDEMAKLTPQQKEMLSLMEPPPAGLYVDANGVRQYVSDLAALGEENERLKAEVAGLTDQLKAAPLRSDNDLAAVVIRRRSGQEQEIT